MNHYMRLVKDKLYYYFAEKNWGVSREYPEVKAQHDKEGDRIGKWKKLIHLNWHYRVLRKTSLLYCQEKTFRDNNQKLPYLDGAESELSNRRDPIYFAKDLLQYDVVSFDIFDTLVLRPFADPKDLFMIVGKRLKKTEFYRIRVDAEKRARELARLKNGNGEITIHDIYSVIEERTGIDKNYGITTELEVEIDYCFANPYMKRVFKLLMEHGKKVIIVSDMYLPEDMMKKLLKKTGYVGYEKLYVSCDYHCSKRNMGLYQYVRKDYPQERIIHIGDNVVSDVQSAEKCGFSVAYYKNCHELGNAYRADDMSELTGSAYSGTINTYLHNGTKKVSVPYEYGFIYGGLYVLGFCNWIYKKTKEHNIDKVLFLSRDGAIYQKVFNKLFSDVPNEYFLWSRIANTKYTVKKNKEDFLRRVVKYRSTRPEEVVSIGSVLDSLSLSELKSKLVINNLTEDTLVLQENVQQIENFFIDNWSEVLRIFEGDILSTKEYIKQKIGSAEKVAIVDVGWLGSGPLGLKYLIEDEFQLPCKVYCLQAAAAPPNHTDILPELMDDTIEAYIFSRMENRNHFDTHKTTNNGVNNIFFELFTQAQHPSYAGTDTSENYCFDIAEVENYEIIKEIHQGIYDFASLYINTFQKDRFMFNVSGYDAYCPYRMLLRDISYFKRNFGKLIYARGISGDYKSQRLVHLEDVLKASNV